MSEQHFDRNTLWDRSHSAPVPSVTRPNGQGAADAFLQSQSYVCLFFAGSLIATKNGLLSVSKLSAGNPILTRDHGYQSPTHLLGFPNHRMHEEHQTVFIRKGALGCNLPTEDIFMPPDQLLLVLDEPGAVQFREHLVRAEDLIQDRAGVRYEPNTMSAFAIVFEDHEIILANSIWTSSSIRQLDADGSILTAEQKELLALSDPKPMRISRPVMTGKRAKQLFSRTNRTLGIYRSN